MKKSIAILLSVLMCLTLISGIAAAEETEREPYAIRIFNQLSSEKLMEDRIYQYVFDRFNIQVTEWIGPTWGDMTSQFRMLVAADDIPDYVVSQQVPGSTDFTNLILDGQIIDMTDMLADYPALTQYLTTPTFEQMVIDGRWWCIPRYFDGVCPHGITYRADWLEELHLEVPQTMDEFYEVLKAVVAADPDGTNTTGFTVEGIWWLNHESYAFTGAQGWSKNADGEYVQDYTLDGYKDYMKWLNKCYAEGLLDPDFVLGKPNGSQEKVMAGRAFAMNWNIDAGIFEKTYDGLLANFPDAKLDVMAPPAGPAGQYQHANANDVLCCNIISADAEKPERIMELLEFLCSEEGSFLAQNGLEGVHYTMNGEEIVKNEAEYEYDNEINEAIWADGWHGIRGLFDYIYTKDLNPAAKYYDVLTPVWEMTHSLTAIRPIFTYQFTSENATDYGSAVNDTVNNWKIEFITGTKDVDADWDQYMAELDEAGYNLIKDDLNAWMAEHEA